MTEPNKAVGSRRSFLMRTCLAALCAAPIVGGLIAGPIPTAAALPGHIALPGHKGPGIKMGHHGKVKVPKTKAKGGHIKKKIQKHKMAKAPLG